jgi:omega-amidase
MRAHLVQLDMAWEDRQANFDKVDRLLGASDISAGDLVLLPEMFDSGFSMNTALTADVENLTLEFLKGLGKERGIFVIGGRTVLPGNVGCRMSDVGCSEAGMAHNRAVVAGPAGEVVAEYSKVHPFTFGREGEHFVGGSEVVTFDWQAGGEERLKVCPVVCYDLRFPELFRLGLLQGAEAFAVIANWPRVRQLHWRSLLVARAIENQAFVLGVNRTGKDPGLEYAGGSIAVGPQGEVLGELGAEEGVLSVELNADDLRSWREKFPAWKDLRLMAAAASPARAASPSSPRG